MRFAFGICAFLLAAAPVSTAQTNLNSYETMEENGDGSFTLNRPRFRYNGGDFPIAAYAPEGACKAFGFADYVYSEALNLAAPVRCVALRSTGGLNSYTTCDAGYTVIKTLTCANPAGEG